MTFANDTARHFQTMARTEADPVRRERLLASADGIEADELEPISDDVLADKALYARLQREAALREGI
jgi:hypothetical protein